MKYYNEIILYNVVGSLSVRVSKQFEPYRKIGKIHQNILVFYKGDPKLIQSMDLEQNAFKPIKEIKIDPIVRENKVVIPQDESQVQAKQICEICGAQYDYGKYAEHEARPFHQDRLI